MEGWLVARHWSLSQGSAGRQVGRNKVEIMKEGTWTGNVLKVYFSQSRTLEGVHLKTGYTVQTKACFSK